MVRWSVGMACLAVIAFTIAACLTTCGRTGSTSLWASKTETAAPARASQSARSDVALTVLETFSAVFRDWPKTLGEWRLADARLAAISGGPIRLAEDDPFRPCG